MQFIDTHIHLQDFSADFAPKVLADTAAKKLVTVSAGAEDFAKVAVLAEAYPEKIVPAFGVHPWRSREGFDVDELREYLRRFVQAPVGEIGVDGIKEAPNEVQHRLFAAQLKSAHELGRPVLVHGARAFDALRVHEAALKEVKFVYHGFVKNRELIKFINTCGGYFGLGAHFVKQAKAAEMFAEMPREKVLFETDAPYQVKEDGYGETAQEILSGLTAASGMPAGELEELLLHNAEDFLRC